MNKKIFFATVGGSHEPLVEAIKSLQPAFVVFVCSERSAEMINGPGKVIKQNREDKKPSLPNIPAQLGLGDEDHAVLLVPEDNLDEAVVRIVNEMAKSESEGELVADYTCGTKTMTAALVLAALEFDVQLYLVRGARADLEKVVNGTQCCSRAAVDRVRFTRELRNYLSGWEYYGYSQALQGLNRMSVPPEESIQQDFQLALNMSKAFDAWDCFNHKEAYRLLAAYRDVVGRQYASYIQTAQILANPDKPKSEGLLIYDLWLNALRRSAQGRYDDAVARVYRIIEWIAQWVLHKDCGIDTSDIPEDEVPEQVELLKNHSGKYQASLHKAWELVEIKTEGLASDFIRNNANDLLTCLGIRSSSIFAHGFNPVGEKDWRWVKKWMKENLMPVLQGELKREGVKSLPQQLPCRYELAAGKFGLE